MYTPSADKLFGLQGLSVADSTDTEVTFNKTQQLDVTNITETTLTLCVRDAYVTAIWLAGLFCS